MRLLMLLLLIPGFCCATEYMPWYRRDLELHPSATYRIQHYDRVNPGQGRSSLDHFLTLNLEGSYFPYGVELETTLADTRHRTFGFDDFRVTGKYIWLDDITGDFVSLLSGVTLIKSITDSLHDISTFHHAKLEFEGYLSFGRECSYRQFWLTRWWGVFAVGVGDQGSLWLRGNLAWEQSWCGESRQLRLSLDTLWGLGGDSIDVQDFSGYGSIRHRSIDLGIRYAHVTECWGVLSVGYSHRLWARNFPENANEVRVSLLYPFGL